jgi:hypothetical protein
MGVKRWQGRVEIPKPGGGKQAILQVLEPILDSTFSSSSFGFRSGRSTHQALAQAQTYVADGREIVVDLDPRLRRGRVWRNFSTGSTPIS